MREDVCLPCVRQTLPAGPDGVFPASRPSRGVVSCVALRLPGHPPKGVVPRYPPRGVLRDWSRPVPGSCRGVVSPLTGDFPRRAAATNGDSRPKRGATRFPPHMHESRLECVGHAVRHAVNHLAAVRVRFGAVPALDHHVHAREAVVNAPERGAQRQNAMDQRQRGLGNRGRHRQASQRRRRCSGRAPQWRRRRRCTPSAAGR